MVAVEERLLRVPEVLGMIKVGRHQLRSIVADGTFPAPLKIGPKSQRWRLSEVMEWIERLSEERPAE